MLDSSRVDRSAEEAAARPLLLCLAASGGGHVRQLLDLQPVWGEHEYFFLTEDTALGRSLAQKHPVDFVPHFALGQARLGSPLRMIGAAIVNFVRSAKIIMRRRPDVFISTGAGAVFFSLLWARLLGARVIAIESFARFDKPSMFTRISAPFAHEIVVQSKQLAGYWPKAKVFDPLKIIDAPTNAKKPLLFATVGATLTFDRLVESVATLKAKGEIPEDVVIQTGIGGRRPDGAKVVETMSFDDIDSLLKDADIVVCHGGTGSLITAMRKGCRVIAMPRLFSREEHYDDHQEEITSAFRARGLIQVAKSTEELSSALKAARAAPRVAATTDPVELIDHLNGLLAKWSPRKSA